MLQLLRSTWTVEFMAFAPRTPDWWTKDADSCAVRKTAMLRAAKPVPKRKFPVDATIPFLPFLRTAQERLPREPSFCALGKKAVNTVVLAKPLMAAKPAHLLL